MPTAFVTGGSGFVGRNLLRALSAAGYGVRALARSERAAEVCRRLGGAPVRGDLFDAAALARGLTGCERMIHAAADTNHGADDPEQERVNVEGTRLVFRAARAAGVARAVHVSSESVLASGQPIVGANESWPIPSVHAGGYSRTKARAELAALGESDEGFLVCAIRPRFVWGRDDTSVLPELVRAVQSGRLKWIGGGRYLTSTTHVANAARGALLALEKGAAGQAYFLSDGEPLEFREFVSRLLATQGVAPPSGSVPRWLVKAAIELGTWLEPLSGGRIKPPISKQEYATVGHEVTVVIDRARRELGYAPEVTLEQGLAEISPGGPWSSAPA